MHQMNDRFTTLPASKYIGVGVKVHPSVVIHCEELQIGDNCRIDAFTVLTTKRLHIGQNVHIGSHVSITGGGVVNIGDFAGISHGARIFTSTDDLDFAALTNPTVPPAFQATLTKPVVIGRHAIVGAGSVVLPGCFINDNAMLGAMSFMRVNDEIKRMAIHAGIPAAYVGTRLDVSDMEAKFRAQAKAS